MRKYNLALVLGSHQGRPGSIDFTTPENYGELLEKYLNTEIISINDVIGPATISSIRNPKPGEILLLDNLTLVSEEVIEAPAEKQALSMFSRRMSSVVNICQ